MVEDFRIQDGKIIQVRASNDAALKANAAWNRQLAEEWVRQNREIRPTTSVDMTIEMEITKKFGPEYAPSRVGKMTPTEYKKYLRIIRSHYPALYVAPTEQRYFNGI